MTQPMNVEGLLEVRTLLTQLIQQSQRYFDLAPEQITELLQREHGHIVKAYSAIRSAVEEEIIAAERGQA